MFSAAAVCKFQLLQIEAVQSAMRHAMRQSPLAPLQFLELLGEDLLGAAQEADLVLQLLDDLCLSLHGEERTHTHSSGRCY